MIIYNYKQVAKEIARQTLIAQGIEPPPEPPISKGEKIGLFIAYAFVAFAVLAVVSGGAIFGLFNL